MENLMLRMQGEMTTWVILLLMMLVILIVESRQLYKNVQKLDASKKRSKKALHAAVKKGRTSVIVCTCVLVVCLITGGVVVGEYMLDRQEEPLVIEGIVTHTGYYKQSRRRKRYRIIIDDGSSDKGLSLYIHSSLIEEYGIEEGESYRMTYYPRTQTLCEAEKTE